MRMHPRLLNVAPLLFAIPIALARCGGNSASPAKGNDGGSGTSSGGGSGGGSGSGSGGSSSGASSGSSGGGDDGGGSPVVDGGASSGGSTDGGDSGGGPPACVSVDGGAQCSAPMMLPCGSTTCNTSADYCCIENGGDGGGTQTCVAPNGSCSAAATKIACKEAADCAGGAVCCGDFPMLGVQGTTSCLTSCMGSQNVQICRTDDECGSGAEGGALKKCVLQTCGSLTLQLCAVSQGIGPGGPAPDAGGAYAGCTAR
jgi:hypothetical protein